MGGTLVDQIILYSSYQPELPFCGLLSKRVRLHTHIIFSNLV